MKTIEYFFECYFNQSANYSELNQLIEEFYNIERAELCKSLSDEIKQIQETEDWQSIIHIAKNKGGRLISEDKVRMIVDQIIDCAK